jgi:hypothetical protein
LSVSLAEAMRTRLIDDAAKGSDPAEVRRAIETMVAGHYAAADADPLKLEEVGNALSKQGLRVGVGLAHFIAKEFRNEYVLVSSPKIADASLSALLRSRRRRAPNS